MWRGYLVGAVIFLTVGATVLATWNRPDYHQRLMTQCMADGHKEYECYTMLKP